jgi:hypothetical protein
LQTNNNNQQGNRWGFNGYAPASNINVPGVGSTMASTIFSGFGANTDAPSSAQGQVSTQPNAGTASAPSTPNTYGGEPAAVWISLIIGLVILKFLSERKESKLNPAYIKIGGYNFLAVGLGAAVFIVLMKVLSTYIPIPALKTFSAAL